MLYFLFLVSLSTTGTLGDSRKHATRRRRFIDIDDIGDYEEEPVCHVAMKFASEMRVLVQKVIEEARLRGEVASEREIMASALPSYLQKVQRKCFRIGKQVTQELGRALRANPEISSDELLGARAPLVDEALRMKQCLAYTELSMRTHPDDILDAWEKSDADVLEQDSACGRLVNDANESVFSGEAAG